MTSISKCFESLRASNQCALIPFISSGDPDLETTAEALRVLDCSGADLIELGVPYSDPLADGPVIQAAATRALKQGTRLADILEMAQTVTRSLRAPIILFSYYNPIWNWGKVSFLQKAAASGIKGLVIPDLPGDEAGDLLELADGVGIEVILLVAPTSSKQRLEAIASRARGFIYLVSVTGVTGARSSLPVSVKNMIQEIRNITDKPVGIGFGISGPQQAYQAKKWGADAVIVGSAFVERLAETTPYRGLRAIRDFCRDLKAAIQD